MRRLELWASLIAALGGIAAIVSGSLKPTTVRAITSLCGVVPSAAAALLLAAAHIAKKQARVHMLPLYIAVTALTGAGVTAALDATALLRAANAAGHTSASSFGGLVLGLGCVAVPTALLALAVGSYFPLYPFPRPSGKHGVGTTTTEWRDTRRKWAAYPGADRIASPRVLRVRVWYPTAKGASGGPAYAGTTVGSGAAPQHTSRGAADEAARFVREAYGTPQLIGALAKFSKVPPALLSHLRKLRCHARTDATPLSASSGGHPVVLFSHGLYGYSAQNTALCETLASHGIVVLAPDHNGDCIDSDPFLATVPDDAKDVVEAERRFWRHGYRDRRRDLEFILDRMTALQSPDRAEGLPASAVGPEGNPIIVRLAKMCNLRQVAAVGHSYGGGTATFFSAHEPRCVTAVALDGWQWPLTPRMMGVAGSDLGGVAPTADDGDVAVAGAGAGAGEAKTASDAAEADVSSEHARGGDGGDSGDSGDGGDSGYESDGEFTDLATASPLLQISASDWEWAEGQVPNRTRLAARPNSRHLLLRKSQHHNFNDMPLLFATRTLRGSNMVGHSDPMKGVEAINQLTTGWVLDGLRRASSAGGAASDVAGAESRGVATADVRVDVGVDLGAGLLAGGSPVLPDVSVSDKQSAFGLACLKYRDEFEPGHGDTHPV